MKKIIIVLFIIFWGANSFSQTTGKKLQIPAAGVGTIQLNDYLKRTDASDTYYPISNPANYVTQSEIPDTTFIPTTVTETKNYYHNEIYINHGINTSTGAITSDSTKDITGYLPIEGSTSITISFTSNSSGTIYGWTYDSSLTPISEIRSNSLISTKLQSYTFTTPSNARYYVAYVRYNTTLPFSLNFQVRSTNTINYRVPVLPEQFDGANFSTRLQNAVNFARFTSSSVYVRGYQTVDSACYLSSGSSIILDGCFLKASSAMKNNFFINEAVYNNLFSRGNRNIKIQAIGNAILQGTVYDTTGLNGKYYKLHMLHFANVDNLTITGLQIKTSREWAIVLEQSRNFTISDINFRDGWENNNQDGIHVEKGCHDFYISNISGITQDDMVAVTALFISNTELILGNTIYEPYATSLDIYNWNVSTVKRDLFQFSFGGGLFSSSLRILVADSFHIHDGYISSVFGVPEVQIQSTNTSYWTYAPTVNSVYNIHLTDCRSPIYIYQPIKWSSFTNVHKYQTGDAGGYTVIPPNGSLSIYRQYESDAPEFIDSIGVNDGIVHKRTLN